jgi:hypothetical protein
MYTGTMIEDLIATVERAECEPEIFQADEIGDLPLAFLLEQSYGDQLVEVA